MFLKLVSEKFPGGRTMFFLFPLISFLLTTAVLGPEIVIQASNWTTMALSIGATYTWWPSFLIFAREREKAGIIWLNIAVGGIILVTDINIGYSTYLRSYGGQPILSDWVVAFIKFSYACLFGSLYLVPMAKDDIVPPIGWTSLMVMSFGTFAISATWMLLV